MSLLTLLTDAGVLVVLVWLLRRGALGHARELWGRTARTTRIPARDADVVRVTVDEAETLLVAHRTSARRWTEQPPGREAVVLDAMGDVLRIQRSQHGAIVVEAAGGVAVVDEWSVDASGDWGRGAPQWVVAPLRRGSRGHPA